MATNSHPSSSASSASIFSTQSGSQDRSLSQTDSFRRLIVQVADALDDENTKKIRYLYKPQFGRGRERMEALAMLEKLEEKGEFSPYKPELLEDLLKNCDRHDLIDVYYRPYVMSLAGCSQEADPGTLDEGAGPLRPRKRPKLQIEKLDVSEIKQESGTSTKTQLSELKDTQRNKCVTVKGTIVSVESPVEVTKKTGLKLTKQDCYLADQSMCIRLEIWGEEIQKVDVGYSYQFVNVRRKEYGGDHFLSTTKNSKIIQIESIGGNLSTETISNTNREVCGEISAVGDVSAYKECTSQKCKAKVTPEDDTMGKCNKCERLVKLSLCKDSIYAKFTVHEIASEEPHDVTAFTRVILQIIGIDSSDMVTLPDSVIKRMLIEAEPATFVVNRDGIVEEVKRD